jgi:hypothetical protein
MTPAQRWMILGGAVVVVILGVFIFFWTRPPAPVAIELEGVVARAGRESFTLSEVTVFSGPQPCSLERLTVQVESRALLPSSPLQPGDLVTVKGEYHAKDCIVRLNAPTHYVRAAPRPHHTRRDRERRDAYAVCSQERDRARRAAALQAREPPRARQVRCCADRTRADERARARRRRVSPRRLSRRADGAKASVEHLPTTVKLQGTVAQVGSDQVILQGVRVLEARSRARQKISPCACAGQQAFMAARALKSWANITPRAAK